MLTLYILALGFLLPLIGQFPVPPLRGNVYFIQCLIISIKRRRRQDLMLAQRLPEVTDTMIEEVQSNHQGAFSYLWEQPAIRALLLPSGGFGIATLLQYLPH
jgi:hypothetical protein